MELNANQVLLEVIKVGLSFLSLLLSLLIGWFIGQPIIARWDMKKKRRELDIAMAMQFHKLYGEFRELSRLWRSFTYVKFKGTNNSNQPIFPDTTPLELLKRSAAAEGGVEAIIVKLAIERNLEATDIKTLGLLRQAYQKLREAIRDGMPLKWTYGTPEYTLFNKLAIGTSCIIFSPEKEKKQVNSDAAAKTLFQITEIRSEDWEKERDRIAKELKHKEKS